MTWTVETLSETVDEELNALPDDMFARFIKISELISTHGLPHVREPYVKHIDGKIWEIRMKGRSGIARALYVTAAKKRVIVVRIFIKKTPKTPRREINLALERVKEIKK